MKKFILAFAILASTVLASCTKENVQPVHKAVTLADKGTLSQADFVDPTAPPASDKGTLSQADGDGGH